MTDLKKALQTGLASLSIQLNESQVDQLLHYLNLLQKWNKVYNLTAIRDPNDMLIKHLFDSLAVVPYITQHKIIDVGTGGGLPGIPLAICYPHKSIDLLDSNNKKTRFLTQVKAELSLDNTQVIHHRVENYMPEKPYEAVISRAFAAIQDMLFWTHHLLEPKGVWWAMKAQQDFEDLQALSENVRVEKDIELCIPNLDAQRRLIKMTKL